MEESKDPDSCNAFKIYELLSNESDIEEMRQNYINGGWGYGHTKNAIFQKILTDFKTEREKFDFYMNNPAEVDKILALGASKAALIANDVLQRVRTNLGY